MTTSSTSTTTQTSEKTSQAEAARDATETTELATRTFLGAISACHETREDTLQPRAAAEQDVEEARAATLDGLDNAAGDSAEHRERNAGQQLRDLLDQRGQILDSLRNLGK
jgi:hypothetical protein